MSKMIVPAATKEILVMIPSGGRVVTTTLSEVLVETVATVDEL